MFSSKVVFILFIFIFCRTKVERRAYALRTIALSEPYTKKKVLNK